MAALGMAGWGLLHAGPSSNDMSNPRFMFIIVFSGMVASAFNGLYMARCVFNVIVFELEAQLNPKGPAHLSFFRVTGEQGKRIFYLTALFIPVMSLCSLFYGMFDYLRFKEVWSTTRNFSESEIIGILVLVLLWVASVFSTVYSTRLNLGAIKKVFEKYKSLITKEDHS